VARPTSSVRILIIVVFAFFSLVFWLGVAVLVVLIVPRFDRLFTDFKLRLPWITERVICDAWWVAPACLAAAALSCVAKATRWAGLRLLIVAPLVIILLIVASLYFPYMALLEGLGGNAPNF
jgi:hypothetical protein